MRVSTINDKEFEEYRKHYQKNIQEIILPPDINPLMARHILSSLDKYYTEIRFDLAEIESAYNKTESIIRQNERTQAVGKNEEERKRTASLYLESFPVSSENTVNMYEWNRLLKTRYEVIKSIINVIENKQQRLITMNGFLKIDKEVGSQYHQESGL